MCPWMVNFYRYDDASFVYLCKLIILKGDCMERVDKNIYKIVQVFQKSVNVLNITIWFEKQNLSLSVEIWHVIVEK
jgi:hypothetical protein